MQRRLTRQCARRTTWTTQQALAAVPAEREDDTNDSVHDVVGTIYVGDSAQLWSGSGALTAVEERLLSAAGLVINIKYGLLLYRQCGTAVSLTGKGILRHVKGHVQRASPLSDEECRQLAALLAARNVRNQLAPAPGMAPVQGLCYADGKKCTVSGCTSHGLALYERCSIRSRSDAVPRLHRRHNCARQRRCRLQLIRARHDTTASQRCLFCPTTSTHRVDATVVAGRC